VCLGGATKVGDGQGQGGGGVSSCLSAYRKAYYGAAALMMRARGQADQRLYRRGAAAEMSTTPARSSSQRRTADNIAELLIEIAVPGSFGSGTLPPKQIIRIVRMEIGARERSSRRSRSAVATSRSRSRGRRSGTLIRDAPASVTASSVPTAPASRPSSACVGRRPPDTATSGWRHAGEARRSGRSHHRDRRDYQELTMHPGDDGRQRVPGRAAEPVLFTMPPHGSGVSELAAGWAGRSNRT